MHPLNNLSMVRRMAVKMKTRPTLSERCTASKYTRGAIAQFVGVSRQTLWAWEQGKTIETVEQLRALAVVLKCKITDLNPDLRPVA